VVRLDYSHAVESEASVAVVVVVAVAVVVVVAVDDEVVVGTEKHGFSDPCKIRGADLLGIRSVVFVENNSQ
jgi:hypothetical protein